MRRYTARPALWKRGHLISSKERWELISAEDLKTATPSISPGDFVIIATGWHHKYSDSLEYFGRSPGLSPDAADYLVSLGVKLVGLDTQIDHPLATSLGQSPGRPLMNRVVSKYAEETGRDPKKDFPDWNPAHKILLTANIPTIEQVGGDVDDLLNTRATFHATPWNGNTAMPAP